MLEVMVLANLRRVSLPTGRKVINENHVVRVTHRDRSTTDLPESNLDGKFVADLRFAHSSLELECSSALRREHTRLDSRPRSDPDLLPWILRTEIGRNAARAVAGDLR